MEQVRDVIEVQKGLWHCIVARQVFIYTLLYDITSSVFCEVMNGEKLICKPNSFHALVRDGFLQHQACKSSSSTRRCVVIF